MTPLQVLRLTELAAVIRAQQFVLEKNQPETDPTKQQDHAARQVAHAKQEHHQDHRNRGDQAPFEKQPRRPSPRAKERSLVKLLRLQNQRRAGNNHQVKALEPGERLNGIEVPPQEFRHPGFAAQVRQPQRQREEAGVQQLLDLGAQLLIASQHG